MSTNPFGSPEIENDDNFEIPAEAFKEAQEARAKHEKPVVNGVQDYSYKSGLYPLVCSDVKQDTSSTGNQMYVWTFTGTAKEPGLLGKSFKHYTVLNQSSVVSTLAALGISQPKFAKKDVIGKEVMAFLAPGEPYNGKIYSKIKYLKQSA